MDTVHARPSGLILVSHCQNSLFKGSSVFLEIISGIYGDFETSLKGHWSATRPRQYVRGLITGVACDKPSDSDSVSSPRNYHTPLLKSSSEKSPIRI